MQSGLCSEADTPPFNMLQWIDQKQAEMLSAGEFHSGVNVPTIKATTRVVRWPVFQRHDLGNGSRKRLPTGELKLGRDDIYLSLNRDLLSLTCIGPDNKLPEITGPLLDSCYALLCDAANRKVPDSAPPILSFDISEQFWGMKAGKDPNSLILGCISVMVGSKWDTVVAVCNSSGRHWWEAEFDAVSMVVKIYNPTGELMQSSVTDKLRLFGKMWSEARGYDGPRPWGVEQSRSRDQKADIVNCGIHCWLHRAVRMGWTHAQAYHNRAVLVRSFLARCLTRQINDFKLE